MSDSSSVANHGHSDNTAGLVCVALAQLPICIVCVLPAVPPAGSASVHPAFHPCGPSTVTVAIAEVCLPGAAVLGVHVPGPSLPVCPHVATILALS